MAKKGNAPLVGRTATGVLYMRTGNQIKVFSKNPEYMESVHKFNLEKLRKETEEAIDIENMTLSDFYNPEINYLYLPFNPNNLEDGIFSIDDDTGEIGMVMVVFNLATEEQESRVIWRPALGDLMEIVWIMAHIGDEFIDKRLYKYKFGTALGSEKFFERYMQLTEDNEDAEHLKLKMMYVAGLVRGYCQEKAWRPDQMMDFIDDIHYENLTESIEEDEDGETK